MTTAAQWPSSVWEGNDRDWLIGAIPFYLRSDTKPRILDATWGLGHFWKDSPLTPVGIDLSPRGQPAVIADHCALPFRPNSFNVVVYDPPHLADSATPNSSHIYLNRYGDAGAGAGVMATFAPFLEEACSVLREDGILICKLADMVHNNRANWHHIQFMVAAEKAGFTVCDLVVKVRRSTMMGAWKTPRHARKRHCFYIICRKGGC